MHECRERSMCVCARICPYAGARQQPVRGALNVRNDTRPASCLIGLVSDCAPTSMRKHSCQMKALNKQILLRCGHKEPTEDESCEGIGNHVIPVFRQGQGTNVGQQAASRSDGLQAAASNLSASPARPSCSESRGFCVYLCLQMSLIRCLLYPSLISCSHRKI